MPAEKWTIGSRESKLAIIQSETVQSYIRNRHPELEVEILPMKTTGDRILNQTLDKVGGKGLFVRELDRALLDGRSQLSVHSLKDMPMEIPEELPLLAFSEREDPRDVLVLPEGTEALDRGKPIGCSSKRRILQVRELYPEMSFQSVRGNVLTRLQKLDSGEYAALVLAAAGLKRLGLEHRISRYFSTDEVIPAAGQGILAVQGRADLAYPCLEGYGSERSRILATAERAFVSYLNGGCSSPAAAYAEYSGGELFLRGLCYDDASGIWKRGTARGKDTDAVKLGEQLAERLRTECRKEAAL